MNKNIIYLFILIISFSNCNGQDNSSTTEVVQENDAKKILTPYNIEGEWKFIHAQIVDSVPFITSYIPEDYIAPAYESGPFEYYDISDIIFTKDSAYFLKFPIETLGSSAYSQDSNYISLNGYALAIKLIGDTLFLYADSHEGIYLEETFIKTTFDKDTLSQIKKDKFNYDLLAGKWFLQRDYSYDYGTTYILHYDYTLQDSILITMDDFIIEKDNRRSVMIKTSGKKRKYYVDFNNPDLVLRPAEWFKGEDPYIHYIRSSHFYD